VATFLNRKFGGLISSIETVAKEDLDLVRLKLSFVKVFSIEYSSHIKICYFD